MKFWWKSCDYLQALSPRILFAWNCWWENRCFCFWSVSFRSNLWKKACWWVTPKLTHLGMLNYLINFSLYIDIYYKFILNKQTIISLLKMVPTVGDRFRLFFENVCGLHQWLVSSWHVVHVVVLLQSGETDIKPRRVRKACRSTTWGGVRCYAVAKIFPCSFSMHSRVCVMAPHHDWGS